MLTASDLLGVVRTFEWGRMSLFLVCRYDLEVCYARDCVETGASSCAFK